MTGLVVAGSVADSGIDQHRTSVGQLAANSVATNRNEKSSDNQKIGDQADQQQRGNTNYQLDLGGQSFDPLMMAPRPPVGWEMPQHKGGDLRLVQFHGPIQQAWLDGLQDAGLEVVQYIHPYTYIVWGKAGQLEAAKANETIRWAGQFTPDFRCLKRDLPEDLVDVSIIFYRGADTKQAVRDLHALGLVKAGRVVLNDRFEIASYKMPGTLFQQAARVPGVYSLQVKPKDGGLRGEINNQIAAGNVDGSNFAFPGYLDWLDTIGFDGEGVIMANVDSGVDQNHPDLAGRFLSCVGDTCGGSACGDHGTHTAGAMGGTGASGTNAGGFLRSLGMAPGADMIEQVYSPTFTQTGGMFKLIKESNDNDAVLSSNSWGPSGSPQGYDSDTMQVDQGALDADPNASGNQAFLYVLAFMNGNGGTSSQGSPDEAKNIFTIGSTKVLQGGSQTPNINDLSSNTAHGPALDGRQLPHMVTGGCSTDGPTCSGGYSNGYCGTSMACPNAAGACALFFQYYRSLGLDNAVPSPAMVKAAICAVAHDLDGNDDADGNTLDHRPDNKQGYGRLNVPAALLQPADSVRYYDEPVVFDNSGESWEVTVTPLDPNQPMRIMLAWSDAVGHGLGGSTPAWNNDLDLVVVAGSSTYRGNQIGGSGWSTPSSSSDSINNMEGVYLGPNAPASATIRVDATNINSDAILNSGDTTDQSFALACYNCAAEPGFSIAVAPSSSSICGADTSEVVLSVEVGSVLGFSDPVALAVTGVPSGASASFSDNPATPGSTLSLTISGLNSVASGSYSLSVDGVSNAIVKSASASLQVEASIPSAVALLSPSDGESSVSVAPTLTWSAEASASNYDVQVSGNSSFSTLLFSATVEETEATVLPALESSTRYFWRVRGSNACGTGSWSTVNDFHTAELPAVLVVDDDDNDPDVQSYYTNALDAMGASYDKWDTGNTDNEPSASELAGYDLVIWFTGAEFGGFAGPDAASESELMSYLDSGGCLFISSQDYMWDRGGDTSNPSPTTLMSDYLGVSTATNDVSQSSVTGANLFDDAGTMTLDFPFSNWSDVVDPSGSAALGFSGSAGNAATYISNETFTGAYLGFPLEALNDVQDRINVLQVMFDLCENGAEPCPADFDLDGQVNIGDFSLFLVAFGSSDPLFDLDGDGQVGLGDFSEFLVSFGIACP
jgi:hypothetical protein